MVYRAGTTDGSPAAVRARVERILSQAHDVRDLQPDAAGAYTFVCGTASYVVEIIEATSVAVRVHSVVLRGMTCRTNLLEMVNEINKVLEFARMFVDGDDLIVATELVGATLDSEELHQACSTIATVSDHYDRVLQPLFGGAKASDRRPAAAVRVG